MKGVCEYSGDEYITSPVLGNHHSGLRKSYLKDYLITTIVLFVVNFQHRSGRSTNQPFEKLNVGERRLYAVELQNESQVTHLAMEASD